ncbi:MAG: putative DNA binding domain-containing protein [Bacteroidetes bacterium]|nr:putative DNA binding domain-containing protein [Bacteroidota bacterium]MCY4205548.1 putative DNA binding domain-containing protein [Bacteroidota bacterium]
MNITDLEIRHRLKLGEDSRWGFKQIEFRGNHLISPRRDDLADELIAFANSNGGILLCGVSDDGKFQETSTKQMAVLNQALVEISTDSVKPPLRIDVHHRELDGKYFVLVNIPRSSSVHERAGQAFIRVGATKRQLNSDERLRLAQQRAQSRYLWFDKQVVAQTGFDTLSERLWTPLLSTIGAKSPQTALKNLGLLAPDESDVNRATVAGILLCTEYPQEWLPQATIMSTMYHGKDRASDQLDAQEIKGPLPLQIADAIKFVVRNMRVAARKTPAREDMPQYSKRAVFEALVNAVIHRDYSMSSKCIRLSMFEDRLEVDSPGQLPNGMTIDSMYMSQSSRNEVLASVFGRFPVDDIPGSEHRVYMMEKRGDGVSIIFSETHETAGIDPVYRLVDQSNLVLTIPAAQLHLTPADIEIRVASKGDPIVNADVLAIFPNKSWQRVTTDESGNAVFHLHTTGLPMSVFIAVPGYSAGAIHNWTPERGELSIELVPLHSGGAIILTDTYGKIPGLKGQVAPRKDNYERMYLYADNISIEEGRKQPVYFMMGKPLRLIDSFGVEASVTIIDIIGRLALIEYQLVHRQTAK